MICPVCRCPGAPCFSFVPADEAPEVFDVVLNEYCFRRMYIPCNVRGFLADYIEEHRNIATTFKHKRTKPAILTYESRSYASDFKHRGNYSKFCGSACFESNNDYALHAGDHVVFTLDNSCFDLKVETFRDGKTILPLPSVAFENPSNARLSGETTPMGYGKSGFRRSTRGVYPVKFMLTIRFSLTVICFIFIVTFIIIFMIFV